MALTCTCQTAEKCF